MYVGAVGLAVTGVDTAVVGVDTNAAGGAGACTGIEAPALTFTVMSSLQAVARASGKVPYHPCVLS